MTFATAFIHYGAVALCTALTGLGVSIGQGQTCAAALRAIDRQPTAKSDINRGTLLALALIETSALLGFLISIFIFYHNTQTLTAALSQIGMLCAIAIPGFAIGIITAQPARAALMAIARQPFLGKKIINLMLITQSLIQTPLLFGFIIALIIRSQLDIALTAQQALAYIAAGLCIGIGSLGPATGVGHFSSTACYSSGLNRQAYNKILSFTVISQAIIETPVIFASIISFMLLRLASGSSNLVHSGYLALAIALVMALGTVGCGIGSGQTAAAACEQIAYKPQAYSTLSRASMIAQGLIDTGAIYAFIIALSLILLPTG